MTRLENLPGLPILSGISLVTVAIAPGIRYRSTNDFPLSDDCPTAVVRSRPSRLVSRGDSLSHQELPVAESMGSTRICSRRRVHGENDLEFRGRTTAESRSKLRDAASSGSRSGAVIESSISVQC